MLTVSYLHFSTIWCISDRPAHKDTMASQLFDKLGSLLASLASVKAEEEDEEEEPEEEEEEEEEEVCSRLCPSPN